MYTIQYTNDDGVGQLWWQCYRRYQQNLLPCPDSVVLAGEEKRRVWLATYLRERSKLREDRAYDCGCNSWSPLRDAVGYLRKELIRLWNSILPEPGQPSAQLSKLIRLTACKKTKHTVSRWYRTVYIPWFVASYDTHKGKRWLNSDPPKPQGAICWMFGWATILTIWTTDYYVCFFWENIYYWYN